MFNANQINIFENEQESLIRQVLNTLTAVYYDGNPNLKTDLLRVIQVDICNSFNYKL